MVSLLQNKSSVDRLSDIYLISNTPYFLYRKFREDPFIQKMGEKSFIEIKGHFTTLAKEGISSIEELALAYGLYIAMTYKDYGEVMEFYNGEGAITYEWFPEIKSIYSSSFVPSSIISLSGKDMHTTKVTSHSRGERIGNKIVVETNIKF